MSGGVSRRNKVDGFRGQCRLGFAKNLSKGDQMFTTSVRRRTKGAIDLVKVGQFLVKCPRFLQ